MCRVPPSWPALLNSDWSTNCVNAMLLLNDFSADCSALSAIAVVSMDVEILRVGSLKAEIEFSLKLTSCGTILLNFLRISWPQCTHLFWLCFGASVLSEWEEPVGYVKSCDWLWLQLQLCRNADTNCQKKKIFDWPKSWNRADVYAPKCWNFWHTTVIVFYSVLICLCRNHLKITTQNCCV